MNDSGSVEVDIDSGLGRIFFTPREILCPKHSSNNLLNAWMISGVMTKCGC